jgi:hypothetical protein
MQSTNDFVHMAANKPNSAGQCQIQSRLNFEVLSAVGWGDGRNPNTTRRMRWGSQAHPNLRPFQLAFQVSDQFTSIRSGFIDRFQISF